MWRNFLRLCSPGDVYKQTSVLPNEEKRSSLPLYALEDDCEGIKTIADASNSSSTVYLDESIGFVRKKPQKEPKCSLCRFSSAAAAHKAFYEEIYLLTLNIRVDRNMYRSQRIHVLFDIKTRENFFVFDKIQKPIESTGVLFQIIQFSLEYPSISLEISFAQLIDGLKDLVFVLSNYATFRLLPLFPVECQPSEKFSKFISTEKAMVFSDQFIQCAMYLFQSYRAQLSLEAMNDFLQGFKSLISIVLSIGYTLNMNCSQNLFEENVEPYLFYRLVLKAIVFLEALVSDLNGMSVSSEQSKAFESLLTLALDILHILNSILGLSRSIFGDVAVEYYNLAVVYWRMSLRVLRLFDLYAASDLPSRIPLETPPDGKLSIYEAVGEQSNGFNLELSMSRLMHLYSSSIPQTHEIFTEITKQRMQGDILSLSNIALSTSHSGIAVEIHKYLTQSPAKISSDGKDFSQCAIFRSSFLSVRMKFIHIGIEYMLRFAQCDNISPVPRALSVVAGVVATIPNLSAWVKSVTELLLLSLNCYYQCFSHASSSSPFRVDLLRCIPVLARTLLYFTMRRGSEVGMNWMYYSLNQCLLKFIEFHRQQEVLSLQRQTVNANNSSYLNYAAVSLPQHLQQHNMSFSTTSSRSYTTDSNPMVHNFQSFHSVHSKGKAKEKDREASKSLVKAAAVYQEGDKVDGLCTLQNGTTRWYPATVSSLLSSFNEKTYSYVLKFDDGDVKTDVPAADIRYSKRRQAASQPIEMAFLSPTNITFSAFPTAERNELEVSGDTLAVTASNDPKNLATSPVSILQLSSAGNEPPFVKYLLQRDSSYISSDDNNSTANFHHSHLDMLSIIQESCLAAEEDGHLEPLHPSREVLEEEEGLLDGEGQYALEDEEEDEDETRIFEIPSIFDKSGDGENGIPYKSDSRSKSALDLVPKKHFDRLQLQGGSFSYTNSMSLSAALLNDNNSSSQRAFGHSRANSTYYITSDRSNIGTERSNRLSNNDEDTVSSSNDYIPYIDSSRNTIPLHFVDPSVANLSGLGHPPLSVKPQVQVQRLNTSAIVSSGEDGSSGLSNGAGNITGNTRLSSWRTEDIVSSRMSDRTSNRYINAAANGGGSSPSTKGPQYSSPQTTRSGGGNRPRFYSADQRQDLHPNDTIRRIRSLPKMKNATGLTPIVSHSTNNTGREHNVEYVVEGPSDEEFRLLVTIHTLIASILLKRCVDTDTHSLRNKCCASDLNPDSVAAAGGNVLFTLREFFELADRYEEMPNSIAAFTSLHLLSRRNLSDKAPCSGSGRSSGLNGMCILSRLLFTSYFKSSCVGSHFDSANPSKVAIKIGEGGFGTVYRIQCGEECKAYRYLQTCCFCHVKDNHSRYNLSRPSSSNVACGSGPRRPQGVVHEVDTFRCVSCHECHCWNGGLQQRGGGNGVERKFAVKRIPRERNCFDAPITCDVFNEIKCMEMLRSIIGVCEIIDYGVYNSEYCLVMEFGDINLSDWRNRINYLPSCTASTILEKEVHPLRTIIEAMDSDKSMLCYPSQRSFMSESNENSSHPVPIVSATLGTKEILVYLCIYLDALYIVQSVHAANVAHFDIKGSNFVLRDTKVQENLSTIRMCHLNGNCSGVMFLTDFGESLPIYTSIPNDVAIRKAGGELRAETETQHFMKSRGTLAIQSPEMICVSEGTTAAQSSAPKLNVLPQNSAPNLSYSESMLDTPIFSDYEKGQSSSLKISTDSLPHTSQQSLPTPSFSSDIWSLGCLLFEIFTGSLMHENCPWTELYVTLCVNRSLNYIERLQAMRELLGKVDFSLRDDILALAERALQVETQSRSTIEELIGSAHRIIECHFPHCLLEPSHSPPKGRTGTGIHVLSNSVEDRMAAEMRNMKSFQRSRHEVVPVPACDIHIDSHFCLHSSQQRSSLHAKKEGDQFFDLRSEYLEVEQSILHSSLAHFVNEFGAVQISEAGEALRRGTKICRIVVRREVVETTGVQGAKMSEGDQFRAAGSDEERECVFAVSSDIYETQHALNVFVDEMVSRHKCEKFDRFLFCVEELQRNDSSLANSLSSDEFIHPPRGSPSLFSVDSASVSDSTKFDAALSTGAKSGVATIDAKVKVDRLNFNNLRAAEGADTGAGGGTETPMRYYTSRQLMSVSAALIVALQRHILFSDELLPPQCCSYQADGFHFSEMVKLWKLHPEYQSACDLDLVEYLVRNQQQQLSAKNYSHSRSQRNDEQL